LEYAYDAIERRALGALSGAAQKAAREIFDIKRTLVTRPLAKLFDEPHYLSAWLSHFRRDFEIVDGRVRFSKNPVQVLAETYQLLRMEARPGAPAAVTIWDHDDEVLSEAMSFYAKLRLHDTGRPFHELAADLEGEAPKLGFDATTWAKVRAAHRGFQLGLELLAVLPLLGERAGFYELRVEEDLTCSIPERLRDPELSAKMAKVLVPPPVMK